MRLGDIAQRLDLELRGEADCEIGGLATLASAGPGQLAFLANPRYAADLADCKASAVILSPTMLENWSGAALLCDNPYLAYARVSRLFEPSTGEAGIHPQASIDPTAEIAANVSIAAGAVVGAGSRVGEGCRIGANTVVAEDCVLGKNCLLHANVTLYRDVHLGDRVTIHSSAILGADGFGFAPSPEGYVKIAQLGGVRVGNDVEIGAGTTVDRGALDHTTIGNGVIIDNQVQVAHNVQIGENTAIAGQAGIAGSAQIGARCTLAGGVGIVGHISIADGTHISARTIVSKSIEQAGSYSSGTPMQTTSDWRKSAVRIAQLDSIARRLQKLEKAFKERLSS